MLYDDLVQPGEYICHHGVKGMKWGVRRFQTADGKLTIRGKLRRNSNKYAKNVQKNFITDKNKRNQLINKAKNNKLSDEEFNTLTKDIEARLYNKYYLNKNSNDLYNGCTKMELYGLNNVNDLKRYVNDYRMDDKDLVEDIVDLCYEAGWGHQLLNYIDDFKLND